MNQEFDDISIEALAASVPKNVVENSYFSNLMNAKEIRKFEKTTGIKQRRYADIDITASDLGYKAAKKILEDKNCKTKITALIFVSQTPDYRLPFTSNILQNKLGLPKEILCLDINAGCAGFVQGLSTAYSIAKTTSGKVLFIVAETLSKILSNKDRGTSLLFGDGAAAILISKNKKVKSKSYFNFFSDGLNADAIIVPDGGSRNPYNEDSLKWKEDSLGNKNKGTQILMDGPRVFDFTLREIPKSIDRLIENSKLDKHQIDLFLFHQSNKFIINQISSRIGINKEKVPLNIEQFGNTSGVSIPLLMCTNLEKNNLPKNILLSGYGVGLNWGNCIISIQPNLKLYDLIEL